MSEPCRHSSWSGAAWWGCDECGQPIRRQDPSYWDEDKATIAALRAEVAALPALLDEVERLTAENEGLLAVAQAAADWFRSHKPVEWTAEDHLRLPEINAVGADERALARAVAAAMQDAIADAAPTDTPEEKDRG